MKTLWFSIALPILLTVAAIALVVHFVSFFGSKEATPQMVKPPPIDHMEFCRGVSLTVSQPYGEVADISNYRFLVISKYKGQFLPCAVNPLMSAHKGPE